MARRIHPRHMTERPVFYSYTEGPGWLGQWSNEPTQIRAQAQETREIITTQDGLTTQTVLMLRLNPSTTLDVPALAVPNARVEYNGQTSWVVSARRVLRQGVLVALDVTTGARADVGGWPVSVTIRYVQGRDRKNNVIPGDPDLVVPRALFVARDSTDSPDEDWATASTGTVLLPVETVVSSNESLVLEGPAALAGVWQADGDPLPVGNRVELPVRRFT